MNNLNIPKFARWKHLRDDHVPPHCMDWRHVCMIHALLTIEKPTAVVEFGCHRGFSSAAVIEAMERCPAIARSDFLDPDVQSDLLNLHHAPTVNVHKAPSASFEGAPPCWIIDGDHWAGAIADYKMARSRGAQIIVIHDTHSHYVMGGHDGARNIGGALQIEAAYNFLDCRIRDGEFTQRGLLIGWFRPPTVGVHQALQHLAGIPAQLLFNI